MTNKKLVTTPLLFLGLYCNEVKVSPLSTSPQNKPLMMITEHFKERLKQRTPYNDINTFWSDIKNKKDSILKLRRGSKELRHYPYLWNKFNTYPNSTIWVITWMGIGLVTENNCLITLYKLQ